MNVENIIEKLVAYSSIHLLLDQADIDYATNRLADLVGVSHFSGNNVNEDEIYDMESCQPLVQKLIDYALKSGAVSESQKSNLFFEIYSTLSLTPQKINETFFDLYDLKPQKAFEWFFEYSQKAGGLQSAHAKLITGGECDAVICAKDEDSFSAKLCYFEGYDTEFWLSPNPIFPNECCFRQYQNHDALEVVCNARDFCNKTAIYSTSSKHALCFDYELPIMRAKSKEKMKKDDVCFELLNYKSGAIKFDRVEPKVAGFINKIADNRPIGTELGLIALKDGGLIAFLFEKCYLSFAGINFLDAQTEKVLKLCAKYLTGGAIYNGGTLSDDVKPFREMIEFIVKRGTATQKDAFAESLNRMQEFLATSEGEKNYLIELITKFN